MTRFSVLFFTFLLACVGCSGDNRNPGDGPSEDTAAAVDSPGDSPQGPGPFDADSSWTYLHAQVDFGFRIPGTDPHARCGDWLYRELERHGGRVVEDRFDFRDTQGTVWPLRNILAGFGPRGGDRLLLVAHWDTRPWADNDPDPALHKTPVTGANDGASGVAVLLELARQFSIRPPSGGVDLLLVDGEDLGMPGDPDGFCQGSRRFARGDLSSYRCAVILDMVADRDQRFPVEQNSMVNAPEIVEWVWSRGERLSPGVFVRDVGPAVVDDHIPFLEAGLPAVDIIDFDYWAWHTTRDDLRAVSPTALATVGRVIASLCYLP